MNDDIRTQFEELAEAVGCKKQAARALGISPTVFYKVLSGTYPYADSLAKKVRGNLAILMARRPLRQSKPVKNNKLGRMWQSMRILPTFSIPDLVATAIVTESLARQFCRHLLRAGYLRCLVPVPRAGQPRVFRLARNTGPHAPQLRNGGHTIWDPNLRRIVPELTDGEVENA